MLFAKRNNSVDPTKVGRTIDRQINRPFSAAIGAGGGIRSYGKIGLIQGNPLQSSLQNRPISAGTVAMNNLTRLHNILP